jgi:Ca2+-binding EF-hand superfamily protein
MRAALVLLVALALAQGGADKRNRGGAAKPAPTKAPAVNKNARPDRYFAICDQDGNGQISFKEAQTSLGLDQAGFALYDTDADGMILPGEFRRRYLAIIDAGGAFPPPKAKAVVVAALPASAEKMLEAFDKDQDGALSLAELDVALVEMNVSRMDPEATLDQLDHDGSGKLEPAELDDLLAVLKPGSAARRGAKPASIDELFCRVIPRPASASSTPEPPRFAGPIPSFRRLDLDGDGHVTLEELGELQRPFTFVPRPATVLAALDMDGDGTLSAAEFRAAMGGPR